MQPITEFELIEIEKRSAAVLADEAECEGTAMLLMRDIERLIEIARRSASK